MTAERLIQLALRQIGNTSPSPEDYNVAFDHLNFIISNWAFWDESTQPIKFIATLATEINLPPYYLEIFELLLAAKEGQTIGLANTAIQMYEAKAQQLTNRLVYNKSLGATLQMAPTTMVV